MMTDFQAVSYRWRPLPSQLALFRRQLRRRATVSHHPSLRRLAVHQEVQASAAVAPTRCRYRFPVTRRSSTRKWRVGRRALMSTGRGRSFFVSSPSETRYPVDTSSRPSEHRPDGQDARIVIVGISTTRCTKCTAVTRSSSVSDGSIFRAFQILKENVYRLSGFCIQFRLIYAA